VCRICRVMAGVGFGVGIGDAVQLVMFCGCRWVTGVGVVVGGGRSSQVGANRLCRGVAGVGVFGGGGCMVNSIGCGG
jgi:hypothetical protein